MELLFAAIAIPCLAFVFAEHLANFLKNWKDAETETWKPRKDDSDYENL